VQDSSCTRTGRGGSSRTVPARAMSELRWPAIFKAEKAGGRCMMSPLNCRRAACNGRHMQRGISGKLQQNMSTRSGDYFVQMEPLPSLLLRPPTLNSSTLCNNVAHETFCDWPL